MKTTLLLVLLFVTGCVSTTTKQSGEIADLEADFPITTPVSMEQIQTFDASSVFSFIANDSLIFIEELNPDNFGYCYSISTGEKLSTLLGRGNAANEMNCQVISSMSCYGDSIQFLDVSRNMIKVFAANDIRTKPLGERDFTTLSLPLSIPSGYFIKLGDNKVIGSVRFPIDGKYYRYFVYDGNNVSFFEEFGKEYFELDKVVDLSTINVLLSDSWFASYGDKVVSAKRANGVMLQIIDLNKKTVVKSRFYDKIAIDMNGNCEQVGRSVARVRCDEKYIYCEMMEKNIERSKKEKKRISNKYILVFDWELNPIKKYFLGTYNIKGNLYHYSEDGKSYYHLTVVDDIDEEGNERNVLTMGRIE